MPLSLTSTAFANNERIPLMYTCDGKNINPPLKIGDVPENTKSLVLILDDPDAPMGTWDHWLVFNIDPRTTLIAEGEEPVGVHGRGSGDNLTYLGPCPPTGVHSYIFKLYALDIMLDLAEGATKKELEKAMEGHILGNVQLIGKYGRKNES